jgi:N-hydroxyarylamine O-acetyltransferase
MMNNETITFEKLAEVLEKTAQNSPFENLTIIENRTRKITKDNILNVHRTEISP